ncbi:MAG: hypothetical protein AABX93_01260 [Nanoarchaeota archaeon]
MKRVVIKGGKKVATREGNFVIKLSKKIINLLKPYSKKIQVAGSIRRNSENPVDIDIVLIPKDRLKSSHFLKKMPKERIKEILNKKGKFMQGGEKRVTFKIEGVKTELYYTIPEEWGACLLAYSSKKGSEIGLRMVAKRQGFKLNQHGLFKNGKNVASKTEEEIYHALGRSWKKPEDR